MESNQNKINLSEKDIEDWLWKNPDKLTFGPDRKYKVDRWIGRQIIVPSGIIDLLGICKFSGWTIFVLVEIKNVDFSQSAILQICRYAADIREIAEDLSYNDNIKFNENIIKIIVGKGQPNSQLLFEANAVDVQLINFYVNYEISISDQWVFSDDEIDRQKKIIDKFKNNKEILNLQEADVPEEIRNFIESIS